MATETGDVQFQKPGVLQQAFTVGSDVVGGGWRGGTKGALIGLAIFAAVVAASGLGFFALAASVFGAGSAVASTIVGGVMAVVAGVSTFGPIVGTATAAGAAIGGVNAPSKAADARAAIQMQAHGMSAGNPQLAAANGREEYAQAKQEYNAALQQLQNSQPIIPMVGQQQQNLINARRTAGVSQSNAVA